MAANQVPVMKHFDSVNKMRARVEGTMAANDDQPSQSRKRSADGSDDRGKAKKAKKGQGTEKLKRVVAAADDEDEDDVVEDFTL